MFRSHNKDYTITKVFRVIGGHYKNIVRLCPGEILLPNRYSTSDTSVKLVHFYLRKPLVRLTDNLLICTWHVLLLYHKSYGPFYDLFIVSRSSANCKGQASKTQECNSMQSK